MTTNFRRFYEKDNSFYMKVIMTEDPAPEAYEFKLQLFKDTEYKPGEDEPILVFASTDYNTALTEMLMEYDCENFRFQNVRPHETPDKHRVFFSIKNKEKAAEVFKTFNRKDFFIPGARQKLYYIRPEEIFVKYGDIEAELYYAEEERRKKEQEEFYAAKNNLRKTKSHGAD